MKRGAILTVTIKHEHDVVAARRRARQIAALVGFDAAEQTRIATAVSEIARNAFVYAGGGKVEFFARHESQPQILYARISDTGAGIKNLRQILDGQYSSKTGMGLGIVGARRLMDDFDIESGAGGTIVTLGKNVPALAPIVTNKRLGEIAAELAKETADDPLAEIQRQNQELLQTLEQLNERQDELLRLNRELEDTNRGVVALYAELDEKAESLRRADSTKTKFLSDMSHEFRTPLNAQIGLTRILLDRMDGDLSAEQEKQVRLIRQSSESLLELVSDLLDIAKIEAGKIDVQPQEFEISNLFSALRGISRPILTNEAVELVFEEPDNIPPVFSDEGKVSQILRNFLSNAIKFTEHGEIRVAARLSADGGKVLFAVADTGIGIAAEHLSHIFDEFTQVENPLQKRARGTGLGLPLCRKLAQILGGSVSVESRPGSGSVFTVEIPVRYDSVKKTKTPEFSADFQFQNAKRVLVIDDEEPMRYVYRKFLDGDDFELVETNDGLEGLNLARQIKPDLICLDLTMPNMDGAEVLRRLKINSETAQIPVIIITSHLHRTNTEFDGDCAAWLSKTDLSREKLRSAIDLVFNERV